MELVTTPFTDEQVVTLTKFQTGGWWHPFTCGRRSEHPDNEGVLIATTDGWRCPDEDCWYVQNWAHAFMADPEFVESAERNHREMWADFDDDTEAEQ